ncbi:hypothetical protein SD70_24995 [Gordoniibacillus kamchatkensis]|uniref:Uncharacterized protein n=1 Tax=Gordoniibacillus kamchatkensis TaxID=1590651 RepID=A0ABR5ACJ8_9BACL|nr:hypothetical protein [Paenibacillus sp. VKM B-2647]KIL38632.1 hypothetical protein SD70_24995 [Paenibacillus sp. VKM B-2647]
MARKTMLLAAALVLSALSFGAYAAKTQASTSIYATDAPDGLRIPGTIELLADTPYYANADDPDNKPEGVFAPQTVKVLSTQGSWSRGFATWQIETQFGPRWIRPKPWEIDIDPPERITLLEETPLYKSRSERGGPVASLSPQEVQVTAAEKQWFYTNDPGSKAWIQVHTTWLGDLWAHIPVDRIGTVQKMAPRKAHFEGYEAFTDLGSALGKAMPPDNDPAARKLLKGDYTIVAEFTTVYAGVQVQTDSGPAWAESVGIPVLDTNETLTLSAETPLIDDIWQRPFTELALLHGEKVTAFEKVTVTVWGGRWVNPLWNGSAWYHVRTSKGTGWVNPLYGEPASAEAVHWRAELKEQHELMRYPGVPFDTSTLLLRQQAVEATAVWDDPYGSKWLKVSADGRSGWIQLWSPSQDRLWDEDVAAGTALQISMNAPNGAGIVRSGGDELRLYNEEKIGYTENGTDYLEALKLAKQLQFKTETVSYADAVMFRQGDYAFMLENGFKNAIIYWHGTVQKSVTLTEHPRRTEAGWYLNLSDARALFGLTQTVSSSSLYGLYAKDYKVEPGKLPAAVKNGRLEVQAFLYDQISPAERSGGRMPVLLSLEENGDHGGDSLVAKEEPVFSGTDRGPDAMPSLFRLTASRELSRGTHQVDLVLRVGERIVWKQTISVSAE